MTKLRVTLCLAVTEPPRMAATVKICAALGTHDIRPVVSDRVDDSDFKHWLQHVASPESTAGGALASDPSTTKANRPPARHMLDAVRSLTQEGALVIVLWEEATEPTLASLVESLNLAPGSVEHVALVIGPRRGLTQSEVDEAVSAGARIATIGRTVVGNHIAAIAGLMALEHIMRH